MKRRKEIPDAIGEAMEPGGRTPAPGQLRLVQQFVNTYNHEFEPERDRLRSAEDARRWLVSHGMLQEHERVSAADRRWLVRVRESLRTAIASGDQGRTDAENASTLTEASRRSGLIIDFGSDTRPRLRSEARGVHRAAGYLLAAIYDAGLAERWNRLKACRQCGWLFFDRSRNRSAEWCSMSICGNRVKNRSYRRRVSTRNRRTRT